MQRSPQARDTHVVKIQILGCPDRQGILRGCGLAPEKDKRRQRTPVYYRGWAGLGCMYRSVYMTTQDIFENWGRDLDECL